jgi:hypothetical protein
MSRIVQGIFGIGLSLFAGISAVVPKASASDKATWAKRATPFNLGCPPRNQLLRSPGRQRSIEVLCVKHGEGDPTYSLRLINTNGSSSTMPLRDGAKELLWAPDSNAFFINGSESAYAGFFVIAYQIISGTPHERVITVQAEKDMVDAFPPCKAANRDETACIFESRDPQWNMSGVGWSSDSKSIFVFGEVPCSSSHGGIMCQVMGYRVDAANGSILRHLSARQLKAQWVDMMGWQMHVPDPPVYGPAYVPH